LLLKQALGHALYFERTRQHLTLRDVALRAPIALSYLSEIERGKKELSSEILDALAKFMLLSILLYTYIYYIVFG
jgi:transcriptional regulator with XRE-family HTH domain